MRSQVFDHIVIGAGGMGSAAIYELARRGRRVLGLERFTIPHELGSSAAGTRIFRFAYFEHPSYVPLMRLSLARWQALERDFGERLITVTGGLDIGLPTGRVVCGAKEACAAHGLRHEVLRPSEVSRRHPAWRLPAEFEAVWQPEAGFLPADRSILAHVTLARRLGADVREKEPVESWKASGDRVEVTTARGRYEAGSLILAGGAWTSKLLGRFEALAIPQRQVVGWFRSADPLPGTGQLLRHSRAGHRRRLQGRQVPPSRGGRRPRRHRPAHNARRRGHSHVDRPLSRRTDGPPVGLKTCMFVNAPDGHFIVDVLSEQRNVAIAAGFSGHGYKFCSGIGEILADLAMHGATPRDTQLFRLSRPALTTAAPASA